MLIIVYAAAKENVRRVGVDALAPDRACPVLVPRGQIHSGRSRSACSPCTPRFATGGSKALTPGHVLLP